MTNVIYDDKTKRARLIDFELRHEKSLSATKRQADDLLVFLLDMVDRVSSRQWLPFALRFLRAYGDEDVIRSLKKRLVVPGGLAFIWWNVRTNFAKSTKVTRRFNALRRALATTEHHRPVGSERARKKR